MSQIFINIGMSLDGFIAGPNRGPTNPLGDRGPSIHAWMFEQKAFRELLELGTGGETGDDNRIVEATFARTGASIMGRRMFDEGEHNWPENAPFHTPVFVLTKEARSPWQRKGGTTFHFVNDGIESALRQARAVVGAKDVRIAGGADVIRQYLDAELVDELAISVAPVFLGEGLRPFEGIDPRKVTLAPVAAIHSYAATHLRYWVGGSRRRRSRPTLS